MLKYFLLWFPMIVIAVANGVARDLWYKMLVGDLTAHQISTVSLIILFGIYTWFIIKAYPPVSSTQAINIGLMWLGLTLVFEFGFGLARGNSFSQLLKDYNLLKGHIWVFIPLWVAIAPYIFFRMK